MVAIDAVVTKVVVDVALTVVVIKHTTHVFIIIAEICGIK